MAGRTIYGLEAAAGYAARCANNGRVAVIIGCDTLARALGQLVYRPREQPRFTNHDVARRVAGLKTLVMEEDNAIPNLLMVRHMEVIEDAQISMNEASQDVGVDTPCLNVYQPFHGVKVVFSGNHLQQITPPGGVDLVKPDGTVVPFISHATSNTAMWGFSVVNHAQARVLVAVVHGNHRLLGLMQELHRTGCACAWSRDNDTIILCNY